MGKVFDLNDRLVDFAVRIINLSEKIPKTSAGIHISKQILRSGTSPAANYAEARGAESRKDFIHKNKISLNELRETQVWVEIVIKSKIVEPKLLKPLLNETDELIAIIFKSIETLFLKAIFLNFFFFNFF